jgi:hypothetical protein
MLERELTSNSWRYQLSASPHCSRPAKRKEKLETRRRKVELCVAPLSNGNLSPSIIATQPSQREAPNEATFFQIIKLFHQIRDL